MAPAACSSIFASSPVFLLPAVFFDSAWSTRLPPSEIPKRKNCCMTAEIRENNWLSPRKKKRSWKPHGEEGVISIEVGKRSFSSSNMHWTRRGSNWRRRPAQSSNLLRSALKISQLHCLRSVRPTPPSAHCQIQCQFSFADLRGGSRHEIMLILIFFRVDK